MPLIDADEGLSAVELEVKQRDGDEGMADAAGADEVGDFGDGQEGGDQIFAVIEDGWMFQAAVFDEEGVAPIALNGWVGKNGADNSGGIAFVAGFFPQFADARNDGRVVGGIDHAAGHFEFDRFGAVAELFDHDDLLVGGDGHDIDPIDGVDDKKVVFLAGPGRTFDFGADLEDTKITEGRRFDFGPWFDH